MKKSIKTIWILRSFLAVLLPLICLGLVACQHDTIEPVNFATPSMLRNIPDSALSVTVQIDDQPTLYQGARRDDGTWFVIISFENIEEEINREHIAVVSWYVDENGEKILVARQTTSFLVSETGVASLGGTLQTDGAPEFDIDCDGTSNFEELTNDTDPLTVNGCDAIDPPDTGGEPIPGDIPVPETIAIEPGCFDMGSPLTEPMREEWETQHNICIGERLHVGVYEVTYDQYFYFANQPENPENLPFDDGPGSGSRPVHSIIWEEATSYAEWLSKVTGENYRLLTEAEWEYVARADTTTAFWTGDNLSSTFENISNDRRIEVGSLNQPNPWGLHDILGNVAEWTCTSFQEIYDGIAENTCDSSALVNKALRGGSFYSGASSSRSATRKNISPSTVDGGIGFRVVRTE